MDYASYTTSLQTLLVIYDASGQAQLASIQPNIINDAELRCYRDLQLLNTVVSDTSVLVASSRAATLPVPAGGAFVVIESANVITPSSATNPDLGTRNPLQRVSKEYLNFMYGNATAAQPVCYAAIDDANFIVGPKPDATYTLEWYGTYRPAPLSATNTTTILTNFFPDLFLAASMVFASAYQRDFGASSDNPQMAMSWEQHYGSLLPAAQKEEVMKKAQSQGWQAFQPTTANPPRA